MSCARVNMRYVYVRYHVHAVIGHTCHTGNAERYHDTRWCRLHYQSAIIFNPSAVEEKPNNSRLELTDLIWIVILLPARLHLQQALIRVCVYNSSNLIWPNLDYLFVKLTKINEMRYSVKCLIKRIFKMHWRHIGVYWRYSWAFFFFFFFFSCFFFLISNDTWLETLTCIRCIELLVYLLCESLPTTIIYGMAACFHEHVQSHRYTVNICC